MIPPRPSKPIPFYQEDGITIYHGDSRVILPQLGRFDLLLTDPVYGIEKKQSSFIGKSKGDYLGGHFNDTPEYVETVCVPLIAGAIKKHGRVVLTPGQTNVHKYPKPDHIGAFWYPASTSISCWGMRLWQPIFYYGKDPHRGKLRPDGKSCTDSDRKSIHPCPKPIGSWSWLLERCLLPGETVIDPFMGSGTTLLAAKNHGRVAVGIEIELQYCKAAVERLAQLTLL